jgi:hypothetical protein
MARITINGQQYDASDEALAMMAKDGVKYEVVQPEKGWATQMLETLGDGARGAAHGASMGLADAKFGDSNESIMQRLGGDSYDEVTQRSPIASTVGDIGGSIVSPAAKLGMAAKGAGLAVRAGKAALGSGVESLVREAAEGGDIGESLKAGGYGAALGAAIPGMGAAVSGIAGSKAAKSVASAVGDMVEKGTNAARGRSIGLGVNDYKKLGEKSGLTGDALQAKVAQDIERLAPAPQSGQSASDAFGVLDAQRKAHGAEIGASLDKAGTKEGLNAFIGPSSGSPGTWAQIQQRLQRSADALPQSTVPEQGMYRAAQSTAQGVGAEAAPKTLGALHGRVSDWGEQAYSGAKEGVSSLADSNAAQASEMAREVGRDELGQLIDKYATQETAQRFKESMSGYSDVADYTRAARTAANREAASSNDMTGTAATIAAAMGQGALGAIGGGIAGGDIESAIGGGMAGLGMGIGTAAHSGTNNFIKQSLSGTKGQSKLANIGRKAAPKIRQAPQRLQGMGQRLAAQGNRPTAVALAGRVAPNAIDEEDNY